MVQLVRRFNRIFFNLDVFLTISFLFTSCTANVQSSQTPPDTTAIFHNALLTATYSVHLSKTPLAPKYENSATPTQFPGTTTPAVSKTPPTLPAVFESNLLNKLDAPHSYIQDTCKYLKMKWDPNNSSPGTVVMPIMFHSIIDGAIANVNNQITHETLVQLLDNLKNQGFESISIDQFANFLYHNAKIPKRSVLLIVDDRHFGSYYRTHFGPQLKKFGWTLVNAWISHPSTSADLWAQNETLQKEGWVDHQAHGVVHNIAVENWAPNTIITTDVYGSLTAEEYIRKEMTGSMEAISKHFGKTPIAYIWPGGGFTSLSVRLAREAGYQLGFTVNPRGPVMFNWVPLDDQADPNRPSYIPDGKMNDPLLVIPRYWDVDASNKIDTVRTLSKAAASYAQDNKQTELDYYDSVCKNVTGIIATVKP